MGCLGGCIGLAKGGGGDDRQWVVCSGLCTPAPPRSPPQWQSSGKVLTVVL